MMKTVFKRAVTLAICAVTVFCGIFACSGATKDYEIPQIQYDVMTRAGAIYDKYGVEVLDLTTEFDPLYLHDLWHVNAESGRAHFMEVVDPWLCQD